jgi:hypothetical protein
MPYPHGVERDVDDGVAPTGAPEADGLGRPEPVLLLGAPADASSILPRKQRRFVRYTPQSSRSTKAHRKNPR